MASLRIKRCSSSAMGNSHEVSPLLCLAVHVHRRRFVMSFLKRGRGGHFFPALLHSSPGDKPSAKQIRARDSAEGFARPCSRYVTNDLARPLLVATSFFESPRPSLRKINSSARALVNCSDQPTTSIDYNDGLLRSIVWGSIFRRFYKIRIDPFW